MRKTAVSALTNFSARCGWHPPPREIPAAMELIAMTIFDCIKGIFIKRKKSNSFASYFDEITQTFGLGKIPRNLRTEAAAVIREKGHEQVFDSTYIDKLDITDAGKCCVKKVLLLFMNSASVFINNHHKKSQYNPWKLAIFIVPSTEFNAHVKISVDEYQNTGFVFVNFGVLLHLCNHFNALLCVNEFLPQFAFASNEQQTVSGEQEWLAKIPSNEIRKELAIYLTLVSAMNVLFHELTHFYRGHLAYLRTQSQKCVELGVLNPPDQLDQLPANERRLLELDADQYAGKLASHFWRAADYPVPGPKENKIENFHITFVISTFLTFLFFENGETTVRYYSPVWRVQQFMECFNKEQIKEQIGVKTEEQRRKVQEQFLDVEETILDQLEKALSFAGLDNQFSYNRLDEETATLLGNDAHEYKSLEMKFTRFCPNLFSFKRNARKT